MISAAVRPAPRSGTAPGPFTLSGPAERPPSGQLPLRGDLAHIALAGRYFVPSYVDPEPRRLGAAVSLLCQPDRTSPSLAHLPEGSTVEMLDCQGDWAWVCCGADGPAGYVPLGALAASR